MGALILGLMHYNIIPNLFSITESTTFSGPCSTYSQQATNGAVGGQCYLYIDNNISYVKKVISMQSITADGISTCKIDIEPATTCFNNKVLIASGVESTFCNTNADCGGMLCSSQICTNQLPPVVNNTIVTNNTVANVTACVYTYSSWSSCASSGTQTRTFTATPSICSGNPVTSQACTYVSGTYSTTTTSTNITNLTSTTITPGMASSGAMWIIIGAIVLFAGGYFLVTKQ